MKEVNGQIESWDETSERGIIQGDDGIIYPFTLNAWIGQGLPEVNGGVRVICQNGRDVSKVEHLLIEHMPAMKMTTFSESGEEITLSHSRLIGGPRRVRSDALAWMEVAKALQNQLSNAEITDISGLLIGDHLPISLRGSVIKYCYGFSMELYLKWILIEAKIKYRTDHDLSKLLWRMPSPVLLNLRRIYSDFVASSQPEFKIIEAHVRGANELKLDWSTFDKFIENIDEQKFIIGRYADPKDYSIFETSSTKLSKEMNSFMDSADFFVLGDRILDYMPNLEDYE